MRDWAAMPTYHSYSQLKAKQLEMKINGLSEKHEAGVRREEERERCIFGEGIAHIGVRCHKNFLGSQVE